ncbi:unnamed protein product [Rhizoctonia solani]|uniref:Uncharacterized protein n=1 Tax=Rhizoctonia solani TaxID=456999 RepID=A0A8H2Y4K6_9AGAM|nr:unnamed protein product [Rhizoctonia solani]
MTLWDIGISSLCLTSSAYLYLLRHQQNSSLVSTGPLSAGYILTNQVVHARLLPTESRHAFSYQTMSLLLSLSALENKVLDCGWRGVIFGYPGIWGRMTGLRPQTYLKDQIFPGASSTTIREKLVELLRPTDIKLGEVWMMTMPSFMGFEGINPLTVYFCYEQGKASIWGIVLEVHNTFGERHAYVLQVGKGEDGDGKKSKGYDHQWTFARQFHVSPFNDRSGHYVCSVILPSHSPSMIDASLKSTTRPRPVIRLHLLTAPPSPEIKLVALLRPTISEPLTAMNLLTTLALPPRHSRPSSAHLLSSIPDPSPGPWSALPLGVALLLTSLRIVYQAALLHYQQGLAVFARPEPAAGPGREWVERALGGVWNDIQPSDGDRVMIGGSIGWQSESPTERWARERFEARMNSTAAKLGIKLRIASTNPLIPVTLFGSQESHARELTLCYRSPRAWTSILIAPTAAHALEVGSRAEHWFGVSDETLFKELWDGGLSLEGQGRITKMVGLMRTQLSYLPSTTKTSLTLPQPPCSSHPLDSPPSFSLLAHCMPMELNWYDGSPPYSVWFRSSTSPGATPVPGLGAWFNLTGGNFVVPCVAPAGSRLQLMLQDSTGWISMSRGDFVVLPSSDSSCLKETSNLTGLSESQGALSTSLQEFRASVINAITASATASTPSITTTSVNVSTVNPTSEATASVSPISGSRTLGRILGPILASLFAVLLCLIIGICLIRRRQRKPQMHIPLTSTSTFNLLDGEEPGPVHPDATDREIHQYRAALSGMHLTSMATNLNAATVVPRNRLRLHDGTATDWPSTVKNRESAVPPTPEATEQVPPTPTAQVQDQRSLEQRAEQLSAPELERLAALVARRLERVRGAPPQYQATEGIGM